MEIVKMSFDKLKDINKANEPFWHIPTKNVLAKSY